jgi:hypothetical protein
VQASPASGSLAGRPVALASSGEALELPFVHARQPIFAVRGRWADPRVVRNTGVTQGVHVRPILVDPCVYLISSADGPVAGGNTPPRPCTTTALLWQNSLSWISTPASTCLSTGLLPLVVCNRLSRR